ncbi:hypothetical protein SSX86_020205 [Deinandra increscens subsp. villosa]|uniref:Carboxypeptidase n=1 Tax=Deinandra increscens subsp. villosa TaxID=3103831 RepID=A0AAP0GT06_9ASTR
MHRQANKCPTTNKLQLESTSTTTVEVEPPVEDYKESMQKLKRLLKAQTVVYGQQTDKDIRNNITTLENVVSMNPDSTDNYRFACKATVKEFHGYRKWYRRSCPNSGCGDTLRPEEDYLLCKHCGRIDNPVYTYCVNATLDDGTATLAVVFFDDAMTQAIGIDCETMVLKNGYEDPTIVPNPILSLAGQEKIYSFSMHKNKDAPIQKTLEVDTTTGIQEVQDISHRLIATAPATPAAKISRKQTTDDPETQESSTQEYSRRKKSQELPAMVLHVQVMNFSGVPYGLVNPIVIFSCGKMIVTTGSDSDPTTQKKLDQVSNLPGQSFNLDFLHYAGYVTVNEDSGRSLFYWMTEATHDPSSKPLLLWLNGGPGCSSIAFGMAEEVGPFHVDKDGKSVYLNPYSWNTVANLLFLDSPAGVGYSYSNSSSDITSNGDKRTAADSLQFLLNWLERFPEYKGRDFYIAGESYAGHYVPQLSQAIVRFNKANAGSPINLKGYMVGNALTDDYSDHFGLFQFMWAAGMISDQTYKKLNELCDKESFIHPSGECDQITDVAFQEMDSVGAFNELIWSSSQAKVGHIGQSYDPCTEQHSIVYFNLPEVQNALHVYHSNISRTWETCSDVVRMYWKDSPISVLDVYRELISSGLRIWIYSGDTDAVIPVTSTRYSIDALNLTTTSPWHAWYEDDQVGGWTQMYEGLTFVTVRGAGHEVPLHKPKQALTIVKSFLAGTSMESFMEQVIESKFSTSQQHNGF